MTPTKSRRTVFLAFPFLCASLLSAADKDPKAAGTPLDVKALTYAQFQKLPATQLLVVDGEKLTKADLESRVKTWKSPQGPPAKAGADAGRLAQLQKAVDDAQKREIDAEDAAARARLEDAKRTAAPLLAEIDAIRLEAAQLDARAKKPGLSEKERGEIEARVALLLRKVQP